MSFKAGVKTPGDKDFCFNGLRFATETEANEYGKELSSRWTLVEEIKVFPSEDKVSHVFQDGQTKRLE